MTTITLDLGNTTLKMAHWHGQAITAQYRWPWRADPAQTWVNASQQLALLPQGNIALCSVVPSQTQSLLNGLNNLIHQSVTLLKPLNLPGFSLGQYNPRQLLLTGV